MIFVYITCKNKKEAEKIGSAILKKRLAACFVVVPNVISAYFWPPKKGKIEKTTESILLLKTLKKNFSLIEKEVTRLHSYEVPCILEIPITNVSKKYENWLLGELR